MKRPSFWAGVIGVVLVGMGLWNAAEKVAHPTEMMLVNVAMIFTEALWIALGAFLIYCFLRAKQREDTSPTITPPAPDSSGDIESLRRKRNWILAFVLLVAMIGSSEIWILNDYTAGISLINIFVIFDAVLNLGIFFLVIHLLRDRRDATALLLYTLVVYTLGEGVIYILRDEWFGAVANLLMAGYFAYSIKAPLNRRNHRIAHFVMLPIVVVSILAWGEFDTGRIEPLAEKATLLEEQFANEAALLQGAYGLFLQKEVPDRADIKAVQDAIKARDARIQQILANLDELEAAYLQELPTVAQKKTLERDRYYRMILQLHRDQAERLNQFMTFASSLDFTGLTAEQESAVSRSIREVADFQNKLTEKEFELNNANLEL